METKYDVIPKKARWAAAAVLLVAMGLIAKPADAQLHQSDFVCSNGANYSITWDGWTGTLYLYPSVPGYTSAGVLYSSGRYFSVRYQTLANPQDYIQGRQGPGYIGANSTAQHRIVFWVDLNNTPNNPDDDQRFDGYMMTQTRNAIAGVTWWNNMVFAFYANNKTCQVY